MCPVKNYIAEYASIRLVPSLDVGSRFWGILVWKSVFDYFEFPPGLQRNYMLRIGSQYRGASGGEKGGQAGDQSMFHLPSHPGQREGIVSSALEA